MDFNSKFHHLDWLNELRARTTSLEDKIRVWTKQPCCWTSSSAVVSSLLGMEPKHQMRISTRVCGRGKGESEEAFRSFVPEKSMSVRYRVYRCRDNNQQDVHISWQTNVGDNQIVIDVLELMYFCNYKNKMAAKQRTEMYF